MAKDEHWLRQNWTTPVILLGIFLAALFLRAYFPWELAVQDRILSGGSDSFYYERIINHCAETGTQLVFDPRLNFPMGLINPRPPLYSWTTCVVGKALSPAFGDLWTSVTVTFLGSTAVWGALTIFPMYFLSKEAFGRRAGILAAFFLAVMPAHLQRSPATNADHDAMVLFFVVAGFFFFLRSLKSLRERRWVEDWSFWTKAGRASIRSGLGVFFTENRRAVLYALLAGWCLTTVALTWQGWAYAPIILLVYFLFQILVHRLRNQDPMGVVLLFAIAVGLPLLVSFPWYASMGQIKVWYDVPLYLFLAAVGFGLVFTATRDYPWALVIPGVGLFAGVALAILAVFYPGITDAFVSGAGYFVRTKAYETIAEAQPPGLSQVILSFGVATYFLALFGLLWMARGVPRHPTPDYLFVVVWAVAAIFMAQAAARFIFNASPAFAMASAWVTVLLLDWLRFDEMRKTFRSLVGGGRVSAFRRSVKVRHVFGSILIIFVILVPNVWYGVDAAIPFERKAEYDRQVCEAYPDFLRPEGCAQVPAGGSFGFGAFGYSLPLEREYFPAAWAWLRTQDADVVPVEDRPAFLSWWDYGFEAVDVGAHPTVADNFLDGYHLAGNFITAQSEEEAIALLDMRLLEGSFRGNGGRFADDVRATLTSMGLSYATLEDAFARPEAYIPGIVADPSKYGRYETLQRQNAQYIYGGQVLMDALDAEELAALNHALRDRLGASIRYFAVDTRLFPLDGSNTGIFYAPVKLSDHRILELRDGRSIPRDFFSIQAATANRGTIPIEQLRDTDQITALNINYKEMFYRSMFYRAYIGFSPADIGRTCTDCIPGLPSTQDQQVQNVQPLQAWNLSHFRVAYRTAYYNPFPPDEIGNHTDAWRAMDVEAATELQGQINRGDATGVVDLSQASSIRRGIVIVKYYDGAYLNGTVRLGGIPWPGVRITVHDEFDVPHDTAVSGADGSYSVLLPFGRIHVQATLGPIEPRSMVGPATVHEFEIDVSDAASMREDLDADGDGVVDWLIHRDVDVAAETLDGFVYLDLDRDGSRDSGEPGLGGAEVSLNRDDVPLERSARTDAEGHVFLEGLLQGTYNATINWEGRALHLTNVTLGSGQGLEDLGVRPITLQGNVVDRNARGVDGAAVVITDGTNGTVYRATAAANGAFAFPTLLPGPFDLEASQGIRRSLPLRTSLAAGADLAFQNLTVYPVATVAARSTLGGAPQGFVTLAFEQRSADRLVRLATTDAVGEASVALPAGTWDVHARHWAGTSLWAYVGSLSVSGGGAASLTASLVPAAAVSGIVFDRDNGTATLGNGDLFFRSAAGEHRVRTDLSGRFLTHLPRGTWTLQFSFLDFSLLETRAIAGDVDLDLGAGRGVRVDGSVIRAFPENETVQIEDPVRDATLTFFDASGAYAALTGLDGSYTIALPTDGQLALRVEHPGFVTLERTAQSSFQWQGDSRFSLVARNVTVSGALLQDGALVADPSVPVVFRALGPGAIEARATLDGTGGYTASVAPGRYRIEVDRDESGDGTVRLQLRQAITVTANVGDAPIPQDLDLVVRLRVDGTLRLGAQPVSAVVSFDGPDVRTANATNGVFTAYLVAGTHTATANLTQGSDAFLAIETLDVSAPTTVALALLRATNLTGTVRFDGNPVDGVALAFARQIGGTVRATSDSIGQYHVLVLGGTYGVTVDHAATAQAGGGIVHVRYTFSATVSVAQAGGFQVFPIDLARSLDNVTVSGSVRFQGSPAAAQVAFLAAGGDGLNATAPAGPDGSYGVSMQPGSYEVYAFAPLERGAFLGTVEITPGAPRTLDIALVAAIRVTGVTTVRTNDRAPADVTFTGPFAAAAVRSSATGDYEVLLPAATYSVRATAAGIERGMNVTYRATASLALTEPTVRNLRLQKVVQRGIEVTWDEMQRARIGTGESVEYTISVKNTGNADDTLLVSAISQGFTFDFVPDRVALSFGVPETPATVRVTITAAADAKVDHGPISVTVRSEADSSVVRSVVLQLAIEGYRGLAASVSSSAPEWDGRFLNYTLEVRNTGNGAETYRVTIPNLDELAAAGWRASLLGPAGDPTTDLRILVAGNATLRPLLRLEKVGGTSGTTVHILVVSVEPPVYEDLVDVNVQTPKLAVEGVIRAVGPGVLLQEPGLDLATTAFLVALVAVIAAAVYLSILRRRSR